MKVDWSVDVLDAEAKRGRDEEKPFYIRANQQISRPPLLQNQRIFYPELGLIDPIDISFVVGPFPFEKKELALRALGGFDGVDYYPESEDGEGADDDDDDDEPSPEEEFLRYFEGRSLLPGLSVVAGTFTFNVADQGDLENLPIFLPDTEGQTVNNPFYVPRQDETSILEKFTGKQEYTVMFYTTVKSGEQETNVPCWISVFAEAAYNDATEPLERRFRKHLLPRLKYAGLKIPRLTTMSERTSVQEGSRTMYAATLLILRTDNINLARYRLMNDLGRTGTAQMVASFLSGELGYRPFDVLGRQRFVPNDSELAQFLSKMGGWGDVAGVALKAGDVEFPVRA